MTAKFEIAVLDTNAIVSGIIFPRSVPQRAVNFAFESGQVLSSSATRNELREVVRRSKFDRYVPLQARMSAIEEIIEEMVPTEITLPLRICMDAKDDKFLELAVNGAADVIVTGDDHLLRLHPFRGIAILSPLDYLTR